MNYYIDTKFQLTYLAHLHLTNSQRISSRLKFIIVWLMMQKRDSDWIKERNIPHEQQLFDQINERPFLGAPLS